MRDEGADREAGEERKGEVVMSLFESADPRVAGALKVLRDLPFWPYDEAKDELLMRNLMDEFPRLDLAAEIRGFAARQLDEEPKGGVRYRARLWNWCRIASRPRSKRTDSGRRTGGARGAAGPSRSEAFRDEPDWTEF